MDTPRTTKLGVRIPRLSELTKDESGYYFSSDLPKKPGKRISLPPRLNTEKRKSLWSDRINDENQFVVLDLFSGAGGMSLGFHHANFFVAAGLDQNDWAVKTHEHNFLSVGQTVDLTEVEDISLLIEQLGLSKVDVVIGGPPCRGFSRVGRPKIRSLDRIAHYEEVVNNLYREFVRFVEVIKPKYFVMENVPEIATFADGELFQRILDAFDNIKAKNGTPLYTVDHAVLNAADFGVPQYRRRLFLQGNRLDKPIVWPTPEEHSQGIVSLEDAISDLPKILPGCSTEVQVYDCQNPTPYQQLMRSRMSDDEKDIIFDHVTRDVRDDDKLIFYLMNEGDNYLSVPENLRRYRSDSFKDKYSKLRKDYPAWTVTAHIQKDSYRYIHYDRDQSRMLSVREFARVQSFPDHFRFCGPPTKRMQQIGNAVPPLLSEAIATEIYKQLINV